MTIAQHLARWSRHGLLAAGLAVTTGLASAGAPQLKTQVPGWYRTMVGDFEVTALYDGQLELDRDVLIHTHPGEVDRGLAKAFKPEPKIQTAVNAFLVNTGQQLILVDAGGPGFGPNLGHVVENLKASGYEPAQVDLVLVTHLHADHVNGIKTADGQLAFPNAKVMVSKPESAFWLSDANAQAAPEMAKPFFQMAKAAAAPVQAAGKWETFEPNAQIALGVKALATGHTPGHSSYVFESKGQRLVVLGDIIHVGPVQFARPEVSLKFDNDNKPAIASRKAVFSQAARQGDLLAGAHLAFPGLGHVRAEGKGYAWVPVEYSPIR
jgi:glyoxylase-like metal-dependent hydrolase (beta-lactamase superfamily II)